MFVAWHTIVSSFEIQKEMQPFMKENFGTIWNNFFVIAFVVKDVKSTKNSTSKDHLNCFY